jgi:hypothetical protein
MSVSPNFLQSRPFKSAYTIRGYYMAIHAQHHRHPSSPGRDGGTVHKSPQNVAHKQLPVSGIA